MPMGDEFEEEEDEAPPSSRTWDADAYHRISLPQTAWGLRALASLDLAGDEVVLDAGCGTGKLTAALLARLPRGRVIALDSSDAMLRVARTALASFAAQVTFMLADVTTMTLAAPCDVVFSAATFHWVKDHARLFANLFSALKSGGRLHAQCGGGKNLALIHARADALMRDPAFRDHFRDWEEPWHFSGADEAIERLKKAGFVDVHASLADAPTVLPDRATFSLFLQKVVLTPHLERIPDEALRARFLAAVVDQSETDETPFLLDYVRLNLRAKKS